MMLIFVVCSSILVMFHLKNLLKDKCLKSQIMRICRLKLQIGLRKPSREIGFDKTISTFISDSCKELYSTAFPFAQALARIGNGLLIETEVNSSISLGRGSRIDRVLLDATGLSTRQIVTVLKNLTRAYKGGVNNQ